MNSGIKVEIWACKFQPHLDTRYFRGTPEKVLGALYSFWDIKKRYGRELSEWRELILKTHNFLKECPVSGYFDTVDNEDLRALGLLAYSRKTIGCPGMEIEWIECDGKRYYPEKEIDKWLGSSSLR